MAKHAAKNGEGTYSAASSAQSAGAYTYPDGSSYGAPAQGVEIPDPTGSYLVEGASDIYNPDAASGYSRENYVGYNALSGAYTQRLKKRRRRKRIAGVLITVLVALLAVGGFGVWRYLHTADQHLGFSDKQYGEEVADKLSLPVEEDKFNILLIGGDTFDYMVEQTEDERGYADVIMLARVDTNAKQVTLVSIPRDTPWKDDEGVYHKINESYHNGGSAHLVEAVEQVTGVDINHVAEVHMDALADFIDSLGGLRYEVPMTITYEDRDLGIEGTLEAGEQVLSGTETVQFVRVRKAYEGNQDAVRQSNVRSVITALYVQIMQKPATELPGIALRAAECVDTDMNTLSIAQVLADLGSNATFYSASGPTEGDVDPGTGEWLCYYNPDGWARLMAAVNAGEDPSSITFEQDVVTYPNTGEVAVIAEEG